MKLKVAWIFGGRSAEHEVSVVTALQAYENLNKDKYEVIPIYASKQEEFYTNPKFLDIKHYKDINSLLLSSTKIHFGRKDGRSGFFSEGLFAKFSELDLAFPLFHGPFGEDGCVQGIFESIQLPYTGFSVMASAVAMDKVIAKHLFVSLGIPTSEFSEIKRYDWIKDSQGSLKSILGKFKYPIFIKPATGGSTIGASLAKDADSLQFAIEVAFTYSDKVIVEPAFKDPIEVNCSALGYEDVQISVCEMPVRSGDLLSYADKYLKGGKGSKGKGMANLSRLIPAPISSKLTKSIRDATLKVFKALDGCGVARIDYFIDPKTDKFWINEINSPPGSLSFYLWEKTGNGLKYRDQLDIIIQDALKRAANQKKTQYTFDSPLLAQMANAKGSKS